MAKSLVFLFCMVMVFAFRSEAQSPATAILSPVNAPDAMMGKKLYYRLKIQYPDAPETFNHDIAPHTIEIFAIGTLTSDPMIELALPATVWNSLSMKDRYYLTAFVASQVSYARLSPAGYATLPHNAPAYQDEIANIASIKDGAWKICVGSLDGEGYLVNDQTILTGAP